MNTRLRRQEFFIALNAVAFLPLVIAFLATL